MSKKIFSIIIGLFLVIQMSFVGILNIPAVQATSYTFTEDFTTIAYKDSANTTANWDISKRQVELIKDNSDQIQPFITVMPSGYSLNTGNPTVDEGRIFVAWRDQKNGSYNADIYEQLLNVDGYLVYSQDSKINDNSFNTEAGDQWEPDIVSYGANSIVVWQDNMLNSTIGQFSRALSGGIGKLGDSNVKLNSSSITSVTQPVIAAVQPSDPCGAGGDATKGNVYFAYGSSMSSAPGTYLNGFSASLGMCGFGFKNTPKISTEDIYLGTGGPPVIAVDSDENVFIAWPSGGNIYLQKFDKNLNKLWNTNLLVTPSHLNIDSARGLDVAIDSSGNVFIAFQNKVNENWRIGLIKLTQGNSVIWSLPTATKGIASLQSDVKIAINLSGGMIYLVWEDNREETNNIYFQKFENGSLPPSGYWSSDKKVSSNLANYPDIAFDSASGDFYVAWNERRYGDFDVFIQRFSQTGDRRWSTDKRVNQEIYNLSGVAQSTKINTITDTIVRATLTATDNQPSNTPITYYMSVDGGSHWEEVTKGVEHNFTYTGNNLRWKAALSTTDNGVTPYIQLVTIGYIFETKADTIPPLRSGGSPSETLSSETTLAALSLTTDENATCRYSASQGIDYTSMSNTFSTTGEANHSVTISNLKSGNSYNYYVRCQDSSGNANTDDYKISFSIASATVAPECFPDGTLIKLPTDPKVYVIINCKKKWIQTAEKFEQEGYEWEEIQEVNSPVIQAYADYLEATANLLRAIGHNRVYRIVNGKRLWVPTVSAFNAQGLKWEDIEDVNETEINKYSELKLARLSGDPKVYYLTENGLKRWIPSVEIFNSYNNKWEDVVGLDLAEINAYPDSDLIRLENGTKVYKLEDGKKRWIKTAETFIKLDYDWNNVAPVNQIELNHYPEGNNIE